MEYLVPQKCNCLEIARLRCIHLCVNRECVCVCVLGTGGSQERRTERNSMVYCRKKAKEAPRSACRAEGPLQSG